MWIDDCLDDHYHLRAVHGHNGTHQDVHFVLLPTTRIRCQVAQMDTLDQHWPGCCLHHRLYLYYSPPVQPRERLLEQGQSVLGQGTPTVDLPLYQRGSGHDFSRCHQHRSGCHCIRASHDNPVGLASFAASQDCPAGSL